MEEEIKKDSQDASLMAIPETCIRDGSVLEEGVRFGRLAWVCPMCTYWKPRTVASS